MIHLMTFCNDYLTINIMIYEMADLIISLVANIMINIMRHRMINNDQF